MHLQGTHINASDVFCDGFDEWRGYLESCVDVRGAVVLGGRRSIFAPNRGASISSV